MRQFSPLLSLLVGLVVLFFAAVYSPRIGFAKPAVYKTETVHEVTVRDIATKLRCPVCQGESLYDSNAEVAVQMKDLITEKVLAGESNEAIIQYFVDRYGNFMLMSPPTAGIHWIIWILPLLFALLGAALLFRGIRNSGSNQAAGDSSSRNAPLHQIEELEL